MEEKILRVGIKISDKNIIIKVMAFAIILTLFFTNNYEFGREDINYVLTSTLPMFAAMIILPFGLLMALFHFLVSKITITITNKRVYGTAAFGRRIDLPLDKISSVGTCIFKGVSVATSSGAIRFFMMKNNNELHDEISNLLNKRQEINNNQTNIVTKENSNADEIKKYKELLDSGAITKEEYEKKKKELLK